ncbi:TonB-dependent receptor [Pedobacter alpinus]|uniref:TonB-dependent receptor domain-containing protein n=1 Tax=Pedobacter alpinus TaxID=1590643 RepID=A0ABW5TWC7_9SPHI
MNSVRTTIIFALLLNFNLVFGQSSVISGTISSNDKPINYATILLNGKPTNTNIDSLGNFTLNNLNAGSYRLEFYCTGFDKTQRNITLAENDTTLLTVVLKQIKNSLNEVVISGTMKEVSKSDSPVPVEVYTSQFFRANPTPSLFESLQNVNGVRPQLNCNVCNTGDIHINGLEGPYTMILIDGMPIVSGLSTVYGLTGIPQSLIERVEIVKGPASTLYGSEAVGGLVNIITKKPSQAPLFSADIFSSNWGDVNTDLGLKFNAGKNVQSLLGVNYFNYQNKIDNNNDGFTDVTLQNRISVFNKWVIKRKENRLFSIAGRFVNEDRWGGDMRWNKSFRGGREIYGESIYTKRWETFGIYQLPTKEDLQFQFSANGHYQNSFYGDVSYNAEQLISFGQLTWNKAIGNSHDILLGASYRRTYYDDNTPATNNTVNNIEVNTPSIINLPGLFIQDEIKLTDRKKLLLGLRYDYNSIHGNVFTPRANYKWTSPNLKNILRFSVGNGYRVANVFTEDHAALTGARTVEFTESLKPETSWNGNINYVKKIYTKSNASINLDASAFYTYFNNRIIPDYLTDPNKIIYSNLVGFATSKGVSLNVDLAFQNGLTILAGTTIMDVNFTDEGINNRQLLTERFTAVWGVGYKINPLNLKIDYTGNVYGPMLLPLLGKLDNRAAKSPLWSLQNIQLTKTLNNKFELYGGVKNLLNFTPPANSIARSFDPFDKEVSFDPNGQVVTTPNNPNALSFDPSYVFAPNQGIRGFLGFRYTLN